MRSLEGGGSAYCIFPPSGSRSLTGGGIGCSGVQLANEAAGDTVGKNPFASAGDTRDSGSIPGSGRSPGERNGNLIQ